jgi:hypothetical protein
VAIMVVVGFKVAPLLVFTHMLHGFGTTRSTHFSEPAGHFSADFDGTPTLNEKTDTSGAVPIVIKTWETTSGNDSQMAGFAEIPDGMELDPRAALHGSVEGGASGAGGTVLSETYGTFEGYPSVDAVISAHGGYMRYRCVITPHTIYMVAVSGDANPPAGFQSFASSFHILKP